MAEVLYPSSFPHDYAYFGMPKRKQSTIALSPSVDDPEAWGILDERLLLKNDEYLAAAPRHQQYMDHLGYPTGDEHHQIHFPFETASIPAGYTCGDDPAVTYITASNYHSPESFDLENDQFLSSIPMAQQLSQLSHESLYYQSPMSATDQEPIPLSANQNGPFDLQVLNIALSNSTSRVSKPKRQFTTAQDALFTCTEDGCGKHFKRIWNFKAHQETHNPDRPKPFRCSDPGCSKTFVRRTDKERHEVCVHSKKKEFRCRLCNSMFARKDTLRRHEDDGCSKRPGFPKSKPKKRRSPVIPNREPNPGPLKVSKSSRKSSISRPPSDTYVAARMYKTEK